MRLTEELSDWFACAIREEMVCLEALVHYSDHDLREVLVC